MKKTLVILANSIRSGGRCVAGKELTRNSRGEWDVGAWIRPVSPKGEGELAAHNCIINATGVVRSIRPTDIVEIDVIDTPPNTYQPENWTLNTDVSIRWLGTAPLSFLNASEEKPDSLWYTKGMDTRRIPSSATEYFGADMRSLFLVRVENPFFRRFLISGDYGTKVKRTASFTYRGVPYCLPLTDPAMEQYFSGTSANGYSECRPDKPHCFIVASLAKPYIDGMRYKIAASILEDAP